MLCTGWGTNRALESQPTAEMRKELKAAGVALPDEEALTALAKQFNQWIEAKRHLDGKFAAVSWYNLFSEVMDQE